MTEHPALELVPKEEPKGPDLLGVASSQENVTKTFSDIIAYQSVSYGKMSYKSSSFDVFKNRKEGFNILTNAGAVPAIKQTQEVVSAAGVTGVALAQNEEVVSRVAEDTRRQNAILNAESVEGLSKAIADYHLGAIHDNEGVEETHEDDSTEVANSFTEGSGFGKENFAALGGKVAQYHLNALHGNEDEIEEEETTGGALVDGFDKQNFEPLGEKIAEHHLQAIHDTDYMEGGASAGVIEKIDNGTSRVSKINNGIDFVANDEKYSVVKTFSPKDEIIAKYGDAIPTLTDEVHPDELLAGTAVASSVPSKEHPIIEQVLNRSRLTPPKPVSVEASQENIENIRTKLWDRMTRAKDKLAKMGLNGLASGLEGFSKIPPKNKILLGIGFGGASVATGGVLMALPVLLSATSFASHFYKKSLEKINKRAAFQKAELEAENESRSEKERWKVSDFKDEALEREKRQHALRAAIFGVVLAGATAGAAHLLFPYVTEAAHNLGDKISSMADSVRDAFASGSPSPSDHAPLPAAAPVDVASGSQIADPSAGGEVPVSTPDAIPEAPAQVDFGAIIRERADMLTDIAIQADQAVTRGL